MTAPWWCLVAGTGVALFSLNAIRPVRSRSPLAIPSFIAGWIATELPAGMLAVEIVVFIALVVAGALDAWPGLVGGVLWVASFGTLVLLERRARGTRTLVEAALRGVPYAPTPAAGTQLSYTVQRGVRYAPGGGRRHLLDVYRPTGAPPGAPVLVQLPGGAWVTGDRTNQARPLMRLLASHGWVCVAANYRLSPRATFPDHLVDVKRVLAWVRGHAMDLGADSSFIAITGGSAGAHLAALAALTPNQPEYQPGFESADTAVQACVAFYGIYDFTNRAGRIGGDGMGGFLERVVMKERIADAPDAFRRASPICLVRPDTPPFAVVHGISDSFAHIEDARAFVAALRAMSSAHVVALELPDAQHAFDLFPTPRTRSVIAGVERFLDATRADVRRSRHFEAGST